MPAIRSTSRTLQKPSYGHGYVFAFVLLIAVLTGIFGWQLPPQIPLFYSLPYGTNQLANKVWLLLFPGLALAIWGSYLLLSRLEVSSGIYINLLKWLHVLGLFLLTISLVHVLLTIL